ncbi:hypothetical protein [Photobacterium sp. 1_MG-2023]|uniref:hypothetical protein n=1 Tax=Photobacterium sp. 1_MG-2023 TaxID=3062646 RepID=UPI0026E2897C|nr:hypothetical protein [Photobacterium sp. 1_MG-2023]MDO6708829.1 hypothetical protein [Photobacterium sp. 1_MG-2023]
MTGSAACQQVNQTNLLDHIRVVLNDPSGEERQEQQEHLDLAFNVLADFTPGVGDAKGFAEAETKLDYLLATTGVFPVVGDLVKMAADALKAGKVDEAKELLSKAQEHLQLLMICPHRINWLSRRKDRHIPLNCHIRVSRMGILLHLMKSHQHRKLRVRWRSRKLKVRVVTLGVMMVGCRVRVLPQIEQPRRLMLRIIFNRTVSSGHKTLSNTTATRFTSEMT